MRCPKCGQKIEENSRYCSFCGASQNTPGEEPDVKTGKKSTWIWVGIAVGILLIALVIGLCIHFTARNESVEDTWQSQYDLGMRFLSDGDYEQAIIAFEASIAIEPYHADVYLALADAYIGNGQSEQARETLEKAQDYVDDERIVEKLKELVQEDIAEEPEDEETMEEEPIVRLVRANYYDYEGKLTNWSDYAYDEQGFLVKETVYYTNDRFGDQIYVYDNEYDEEGRLIKRTYTDYDENNNIISQVPDFAYYIYDEEGRLMEEGGGETSSSSILYTYEGEKVVGSIWRFNEVDTSYEYEYIYDDSGALVGKTGVQKIGEDIAEEIEYSYEYDSENRLIRETQESRYSEWVETSVEEYSYDKLFVIRSFQDGFVYLSIHDIEGNSVLDISAGDNPELTYDEDGNLIQAVSSYGSYEFIYETVTKEDLDESEEVEESEALETTDESEFLSLYSPVLDMFYRNVQNGWQELNAADISMDSWEDPLSPNSVSYLFYWPYSGIESLSDVGYAIIDIDGNGTPELLMAGMGDSEGIYEDVIYNLYTYIDGDIVFLASSGERYQYSLSASDGLIYEISSTSASTGYYNLYKINNETGKLEVVEAVVFDDYENENAPWFHATGDYYYTEHDYDYSVMESITQEEVQDILERIGQVVSFEMTPLSEYTPTNA